MKLLLVLMLISAPALAKPDWRSTPPKPATDPAAPTPTISRATLDNGLVLLVHERHDVPFVVLRALLPAGDSAQPPGKEGLAAFTAEMLQAGTATRDPIRLADDLALLGAELSTDTLADAAFADIGVLKAHLPEAVSILGDVVVHPALPASELERVRARRLSQIVERADDPSEAMRDVLAAVAFGPGHPYAAPHLGTAESVKKITRDDLRNFWASRYRPGGAALIFAGDVTLDEAVALAKKSAFASWPKAAAAPITPAAPTGAPQRGIVLVDKPDAPQSQVGFVFLTVPASHADRVALEVADACLGGTFSSRLNLNLRERHGYAYYAASAIGWHRGPSYLVARAGIRTDVTIPSLIEFRAELRRLVADPPTAEEVALARSQLVHGVTGEFETLEGAASAIAEIFLFDLPPDHFARYAKELAAITPERVKEAISNHIHPDRATLVIIGDRNQVEPELTIQRRDSVGRIVK